MKETSEATLRQKVLEAARQATVDREGAYSDPTQMLDHIAEMWSAYLGHSIEACDVSCMMVMLKIARIKAKPDHEDSWVDISGYAAIGAEASL